MSRNRDHHGAVLKELERRIEGRRHRRPTRAMPEELWGRRTVGRLPPPFPPRHGLPPPRSPPHRRVPERTSRPAPAAPPRPRTPGTLLRPAASDPGTPRPTERRAARVQPAQADHGWPHRADPHPAGAAGPPAGAAGTDPTGQHRPTDPRVQPRPKAGAPGLRPKYLRRSLRMGRGQDRRGTRRRVHCMLEGARS